MNSTIAIKNNTTETIKNNGYQSGEEKHGDEFGECAICYTELTTKTTVATPCDHLFCSKCFFKWLHESKLALCVEKTMLNIANGITKDHLKMNCRMNLNCFVILFHEVPML